MSCPNKNNLPRRYIKIAANMPTIANKSQSSLSPKRTGDKPINARICVYFIANIIRKKIVVIELSAPRMILRYSFLFLPYTNDNRG